MYNLLFSTKFTRKMDKLLQKNPSLEKRARGVLAVLQKNPFDRSLKSHKTHDRKNREIYASRLTKDLRITWMFYRGLPRILNILDIGGHSGSRKVYK